MSKIEFNKREDKFLYITNDYQLRIVDHKNKNKKSMFTKNKEKYLNAKWLNNCEAIIAFSKNQVFF